MINLDLTDAYLTVPMHPDSQKFLRFLLGDKTFQFTAMPFGLNLAPRLFTKIMKPVVASLRSKGVRLIIHLDDILIIASSVETLNSHKKLAVDLLESLGFLINYKKSSLTPSQQITFLGMLVDSVSMQFILPPMKSVQIQKDCSLLLNTPNPTIRHLSRVLGLLESCRPAVWSAPLHYRQIQTLQITALQRWSNYDTPVVLTPAAKSDLLWWITALQTQQGSRIIPPIADLTIASDASKQGWGASWGTKRSGGCLEQGGVSGPHKHIRTPGSLLCTEILSFESDKQSHLPKNGQYHGGLLPEQHGRHSLPPTTPPSYGDMGLVREEESISSCTAHPRQDKCRSGYGIQSEAGSERLDATSKGDSASNQTLHSTSLCLSHQLRRYVSWRLDPNAMHSDAFTLDWSNLTAYAFPPFSLIPAVLHKAKREQATLVLVAPLWTTQPWWPLLIELLVDYPVYLGNNPKLLQEVSSPGVLHPLFPALRLAVWRISGNITKQWEFQKKLSNSCVTASRALLPKRTMSPGLSGVAGVRRGKVIPYYVQCLTF